MLLSVNNATESIFNKKKMHQFKVFSVFVAGFMGLLLHFFFIIS